VAAESEEVVVRLEVADAEGARPGVANGVCRPAVARLIRLTRDVVMIRGV
jgi:hypothetical protein